MRANIAIYSNSELRYYVILRMCVCLRISSETFEWHELRLIIFEFSEINLLHLRVFNTSMLKKLRKLFIARQSWPGTSGTPCSLVTSYEHECSRRTDRPRTMASRARRALIRSVVS